MNLEIWSKILWIFFFTIYINNCLAVKRPNKDEYKTIDTSRKIIKRIEDCSVDTRDSLGLFDNSESPIITSIDEVVCGETTFMQITRLNENKIENIKVQREAMSAAYKAIQQLNDFYEIASFIEKNIPSPPKGQWLCIIGRAANFDTSLKQKIPEYLDFTISLIKVQLFNIGNDCSTTNTTEIKLNPNATPSIKHNTLTAEKKKDVLKFIKLALKEYSSSTEGLNYICPFITNEIAINYGLIKWTCVAGEKNSYQFTHTFENNHSFRVQYDNLIIEIVEIPNSKTLLTPKNICPSPVPTFKIKELINQYDIINEARNIQFKISINETRMDYKLQTEIIQIIYEIINTQPTFDAISKKLQERLNNNYGQYWAIIVGTDTQYWTYFYVLNPFFINLRIERLRIILYKQMPYRI